MNAYVAIFLSPRMLVIATHRLQPVRALRLAAALAIAAGLLVGYPAWAASARQAAGAAQLEQLFAGSTLADYRSNLEGGWESEWERFYQVHGPLTAMSYSTDVVARERLSWNVFFAVRCVVAEWTPSGFTTTLQSGSACSGPFHP